MLEFIVGYGGNPAPTATPILKVNGSATNVGAVSCTLKSGHNNCTATYNPSSLTPGLYTITATQPADSNYTASTSANDSLTITGPVSQIASPVKGVLQTGIVATKSVVAPGQATSRIANNVRPASIMAAPARTLAPAFIAPLVTVTPTAVSDDPSDTKSEDSATKQPK